MAAYVSSYLIAAVLLFLAMGGRLPSQSSTASSLQGMTSETDTLLGMGFQIAIWLAAAVWMSRHLQAVVDGCRTMKVVVALTLLAPLSALWSQNPVASLRRGTFLVVGTLFAFALVRSYTAEALAELVVIAGAGAGVLGILTCLFVPQVGLDAVNGGAWEGLFRSKNGCATVMLFFLSPAVAFRFRSRVMSVLRYVLFAVAFVLIVMSNAKTAWILTPAYFLLIAVAAKLKRFTRRDATMLVVAGASGVVLLAVLVPLVLPVLLPLLGKDPSISGRIPLWGAALVSLMKRPLFGYGYAAFWTGLQGESLNIFMSTQFEINQAQNGLLEVGLELGLLGVCLAVLSLIRAIRDAIICFQYAHSDVVNWYVGLLALTISYNVDEAFLVRENFLPWLLYLVACTGLAKEARKATAARALMVTPLIEAVRPIPSLAAAA